VLKENASLKLLNDDKGQTLATVAGNTILVDRPHHLLSTIRIHKKTRNPTTAPMSYWISCRGAKTAT